MTYLPLFLLFSLACCTPGGSGYSSGADSEAATLVHTAEGISSGLQTGHLLSRKVRKSSSKKVAKSGKKSKKTGKKDKKSVQRSKNGKKPGQKAKKSKNKDQKTGRKVKKTEKFGKKVIQTKKSKKTGKKAKKSEKKSKKTKKSGKKFRNKAKKSGKKSKKTKKSGKKFKNKATKSRKKSKNSGKKEKKFMKSKNKSRKKKRKGEKTNKQSNTISNACFSEFVKLAKLYGNQAKNVEKQANRAKDWARKIAQKNGKKADFDASYSMILAAAGGDPNDPKCQGKTPEAGDPLAGIINTLKDCKATIEAQCSASSLDQDDTTTVIDCLKYAQDFRTYYDNNLADIEATATAPNDVCNLVNAPAIKTLKSSLIACRNPVLAINNAQKTKNTACKKAFGDCKKQAIASTDRLDKCKLCTSDEVDQLCRVNTALTITIAIFGNALYGLGLAGGTGSNGVCGACTWGVPIPGVGRKIRGADIASEYNKLPSHKLARDVLSRTPRQDGAGCKAVRSAWEEFNATATAAGMSSGQKLNESYVNSTISSLNAIAERKNLTDDLNSCDAELAEISGNKGGRLARQVTTVTLSIVYIRVYYFWCMSWQQVVIVARIQILITTYSLPTPACIISVG